MRKCGRTPRGGRKYLRNISRGLADKAVVSLVLPQISCVGRGKQQDGLDSGLENGAGEGIRTLDPDLGKVVLYP